ncbi:MAG TPA: glycosyltransferase family 39 protein [Candidatus Polarisedimenticolaceae bacterium]|nr:glycosyltransferase family 39 protein [Candidatus Polarisedimenticolaceae bacterium]
MNRKLWVMAGKYRYQLGIAAILLLATFMRFYHLPSLPPGLHADEAANGLDIIRMMDHHDFRPFYDTNGGREALFFYLQAIGVQLLGTTIIGLRVVPALLGVLAVAAVYVWLSNWFGRRVAITAALIMAVSPWAVTISRDGFRAGMMALMVPLTLWLFTKAVQTKDQRWYIAAGVSLGLGFYTYPAFWIIPLLLAAFMGYLMHRKHKPAPSTPGIGKSLAAALVVMIPLIWYGIQHIGAIVGRPAGVSIFNNPDGFGGAMIALGDSIVKTLLMFNVHGDENYRHNLGGQPELNIFVGAMFVLGILVCITHRKRLPYAGLLALLVAMLIPAIFTAEGLPHALRAYGALPATVGLAAIGTLYLLDQWRAVFPLNAPARAVGGTAIGILLLLTVYQGYTQYFTAWANSPETYVAYREDTASLAKYYNARPFSGQRYAIAEDYEMKPVQYLTHKKAIYRRLDTREIEGLPLEPGTAKEFSILSSGTANILPHLERKFPKLTRTPHYSEFDGRELFVTYTVPAS